MRAQAFEDENSERAFDSPSRLRSASDTRTLGSLFVELTRELNDLFLTEVELTRTEVTQKIEQAATGIVILLVGGMISVAGLMALVAAAVVAVNNYLVHEWALSALIVGVAVMAIGGAIAMVGKSRMEARDLVPERAARNVKRDVRFLKEELQRRV
jgi:hypothetical protein